MNIRNQEQQQQQEQAEHLAKHGVGAGAEPVNLEVLPAVPTFTAMRLYDNPEHPELGRLLAKVMQRIQQHPELLQRSRTAYYLDAELTPAYGTPGMVSDADAVHIAFRDDGLIYDLDEVSRSGRCSGGWMGSCIPAGRVVGFARAWLEQTDPARLDQLALF